MWPLKSLGWVRWRPIDSLRQIVQKRKRLDRVEALTDWSIKCVARHERMMLSQIWVWLRLAKLVLRRFAGHRPKP